MSLSLSITAFVAGVLMFLAPCTLPIVPGYLAFIAGEGRRVVRNAIFFVAGFTAVFVLLGASAGLFGIIIGGWRQTLAQLGGLLLMFFGLTMLGLVRIPVLSGERHIALPKFLRVGYPHSSFLIGALFALGWSPCIGPILGSILFVASASATALQGALLLFIFSMGLGLPLVLTALLLDRAQTALPRLARFSVFFSMLGGALLVFLGALMLLGQSALLVEWGFSALHFIQYDQLLKYM